MSELSNVNQKIKDLLESLRNFDYEKESEEATITKLTEGVKKLRSLLDNGSVNMEDYVAYIDELKQTAERTKTEANFTTQGGKIKTGSTAVAKFTLGQTVAKVSDLLLKQKEAVTKYSERYGIDDIISAKKDRKDATDKGIEDCKNNVEGLNKIRKLGFFTKYTDDKRKIEEAKNVWESFKRAEEDYNIENGKADKDLDKLNVYEKYLKHNQEELSNKLNSIGLTYSAGMSEPDWNAREANAEKEFKKVIPMLNSRQDIQESIGFIGEDEKPEDILKTIDKKIRENKENSKKLQTTSTRLEKEIAEIEQNKQKSEQPFQMPADDTFTIEEGQLRENSQYQELYSEQGLSNKKAAATQEVKNQLANRTRKDIVKAREEYLKKDFTDEQKAKRHPLIWLKARIRGKKIDKKIEEETIDALYTKKVEDEEKKIKDGLIKNKKVAYAQEKKNERLAAEGKIKSVRDNFASSLRHKISAQNITDAADIEDAFGDIAANTKVPEDPQAR